MPTKCPFVLFICHFDTSFGLVAARGCPDHFGHPKLDCRSEMKNPTRLLGSDQLELITSVGKAQLLHATGRNLHYARHCEFLSQEQIAYIVQKESKAHSRLNSPTDKADEENSTVDITLDILIKAGAS